MTPAVHVVALVGELDAFHAPRLREELHGVIAEHPTVLLDLSAVTFLDSTILGVLVGALRRAREEGGELQVVLPTGPARRIFELTNLDQVFQPPPS